MSKSNKEIKRVVLAYSGGHASTSGILNVANDLGKANTAGAILVAGLSAPSAAMGALNSPPPPAPVDAEA